jgi:enediyne biosynthesis protein E4
MHLNCVSLQSPDSTPRHAFPGKIALLLIAFLLQNSGCGYGSERDGLLFRPLEAVETGITFENTLVEDSTFNMLTYLYFYNGGGVAAGDVNSDGLVDLYFTGNQLPNRLYLNHGGFSFEDVTESAGVAGRSDWTTGVTMADVNGDGYLDIYVSAVTYLDQKGTNELFINNGDGTFDERAEEYGLNHVGYSVQSAFFDYDGDGDLDVYLLSHSTHAEETFGPDALRYTRSATAGDKLFRNEDGFFVDVSEEAGIYGSRLGYGLGVVVSDLDRDGCPDLYVANDFHEQDYLYYNNCDGTFEEQISNSVGHTSRASMGVDAADFNNDGLPDIIVLDMMPDRQDVFNSSVVAESMEIYNLQRRLGYHDQLMRNTLQLNRGNRRFSEIAYLSGVQATDWSWAPLFSDLDNDGLKDIFITNGILRRPNDKDFIRFISSRINQSVLERGMRQEDMQMIERMPDAARTNYAFRNVGEYAFQNVSDTWGLDDSGYSSGAAYADLDNDGDLDLIVNNINDRAWIYENLTDRVTGNHYLTISLKGNGANTAGIGTKAIIRSKGQQQLAEAMPTRGFQSSVDPRLHFGLGSNSFVDTLIVVWPDQRYQFFSNVPGDTLLSVSQENASGVYVFELPEATLFEDVTDRVELPYKHEENKFVDFNRERLMPQKVSTEGPALAVGDINGDGLDDIFAGGAKRQPAALMLQQPGGTFLLSNEDLWRADSLYEDVDALFFDADGDGDLDLYVVSGGNEFWGNNSALRDRLYLNVGNGDFERDESALPDLFANGCCVTAADYDQDGDQDLFVGSRIVSRHYGESPRSYLLLNDGSGTFSDVTERAAAGLSEVGMVTEAAWANIVGDDRLDLIVVGEWMPLTVFSQMDGTFVDRTDSAGFGGTEGWWNTVSAVDMDGDGDMDLVAGNLGRNSVLQVTPEHPVRLQIKDVDGNGDVEHLITSFRNGAEYPLATADELIEQIPSLGRKYRTYQEFGARRLENIFSPFELEGGIKREVRTFSSVYAENLGDGTFRLTPLPVESQFSPVYAVLSGDFDADSRTDVILAGNFYGVKPVVGRYDAGYGLLLSGTPSGPFRAHSPSEIGLFLEGQIRDLKPLRYADGSVLIVVARNDDRLQLIRTSL